MAMKRRAIRIARVVFLIACALSPAIALWRHPSQAQGDEPLVLLKTIDVGGSPDAIAVDCWADRHDVVFYDRSGGKVRFIDGDTLALLPEEIPLSTWAWEGWIAYDRYHHHSYLVTTRLRETGMRVVWKEVLVHTIAGRSLVNTFSVNEQYNTDPFDPADKFYSLEGLALKQPMSEGDGPARLIVDDTANGNVDVVDLNATGTDAVLRQRYSYRPSPCGESSCSFSTNPGNSLALETNHETLAVDDLASTDVLYVADLNHTQGHIHTLQLNHPLQNLNAVPLPDVDLTSPEHWPFSNGNKGIAMAEGRDTLWAASGWQSFDEGYVGWVDTTVNQMQQVLSLQYADEGFMHVDFYDANRAFVATADEGGYYDPTLSLYLHLIYDGTLVDTLPLLQGYEEYEAPLRGMAFDPYHRRLYLTVGSSVMVVQVNYGAGPAPPPPIVASAAIFPEGGTLVAPGSRAQLDVPPGAVDQTTVVTYTEAVPSPAGDLFGVRFFDLSAVISGTTTPVTSFNAPYTLTINYTDAEEGAAIEDTLRLYWRDGDRWILEPTGSVDAAQNRLTAYPDHMTLFAVLGETRRVYLPLAWRNP